MGLIEWIKGVFQRMFQPAVVYDVFGVQPAMTSAFMGAITNWENIYQGIAPWNDEKTPSANFASIVAGEAARLATIEMNFTISGSPRADYLQKRFDIVRNQIRTQTEYAVALGGLILKPNGTGTDYIKPGTFIPTDVDGNGNVTGAIFISQRQDQHQYFNRFEYHRFENGIYRVSNKAYEADSPDIIGRPTTLAAVPEWESIEPEVSIKDLEKPLFAYFKMPWANTVDPSCPLGCSIFSKAIGSIHDVDITAAGLRHEIKTAKRKVFISDKVLQRDENGNVVPSPVPDLIQGLEFGVDEKNTYHEFNPQIRIEQYKSSLQTFLNMAGNQCGFSNGYFSFDEKTGMITATQVEADQQRTISTVTDIQKALKSALSDLAYAFDAYASLYNLAPAGAYTENYELKDLSVNVIEDRQRAWQMATAGAIPKWKYLVDYEGYTEEDAKQIAAEANRKQMFWSYVISGKYPMWRYLMEFEGMSKEDAQAAADEAGSAATNDPYGFSKAGQTIPQPGDTGGAEDG